MTHPHVTLLVPMPATTQQVIDTVLEITNELIQTYQPTVPSDMVANHERRYLKGNRHLHVFGMGNGLRDTLVADYMPSTRHLQLTFPANYRGWDAADFYTRLRVSVYDRLCGNTVKVENSAEVVWLPRVVIDRRNQHAS